MLILQGTLYTLIAALTPLTTALSSNTPLTSRYLVCLAIGSLIAGATALKAFLSTNFSDSTSDRKPVQAEIVNTPDSPVNTTDVQHDVTQSVTVPDSNLKAKKPETTNP